MFELDRPDSRFTTVKNSTLNNFYIPLHLKNVLTGSLPFHNSHLTEPTVTGASSANTEPEATWSRSSTYRFFRRIFTVSTPESFQQERKNPTVIFDYWSVFTCELCEFPIVKCVHFKSHVHQGSHSEIFQKTNLTLSCTFCEDCDN